MYYRETSWGLFSLLLPDLLSVFLSSPAHYWVYLIVAMGDFTHTTQYMPEQFTSHRPKKKGVDWTVCVDVILRDKLRHSEVSNSGDPPINGERNQNM